MNLNRSWLSRDPLIFIVIFLISLSIRLPLVSFPNTTVMDESLFIAFATNTLNGRPFFEPHPPLGWLSLSVVSYGLSTDKIADFRLVNGTNQPFGGFPYTKGRTFSAIWGSLIPALIYILGRLLGLGKNGAILPAVLAIFDGGLIIHSRIMMPDSMLIALGLMGVLFTLFADRFQERKRYLLLVLAGLFIGCAVATKWTAMAFLAVAIMAVLIRGSLFKKKIIDLSFIVFSGISIYIFIFLMYFNIFYSGPVDTKFSLYKNETVKALVFPGAGEWLANFKFIYAYNKVIFNMHASSKEVLTLKRGSDDPILWPIFAISRDYWGPDRPYFQEIVLKGNIFSWGTALVSLVILIGVALFALLRRKLTFSREEGLLIVAYAINYVPFIFINKWSSTPTWFFHYLPALCFSFLLIPFAIQRLFKSEKVQWGLHLVIILGTITVFFYQFPTIYGL